MRLLSLALFLLLSACSKTEDTAMPGPSADFSRFVDDYFDALFSFNPSWGTSSGLHQYDNRIEDLSAQRHESRIAELKQQESRLADLTKMALNTDETIDAELLESQIDAELLELETVQGWRRNPMNYVGVPGGAIDGLVKRNFAPPADRLRTVILRLKGVPAVLEAMRQNVSNPPREFTDLAIRMANGSEGFFKVTLEGWAREAAGSDAALKKEFDDANRSETKSIEEAADWLEKQLLPASNGAYAIGPDIFAKKLFYEEMVDTPLDRLLAIGEANLERDTRAFREVAAKIAPASAPAKLMHSISDDHPTEQSLIGDARKTVEDIIQFIRDKKIVTIPSEVRPTIIETPGYLRSGGFASMDTPGAYETSATEAFYYVTPPEADWDLAHKQEHLRLFNPPVMKVITIHEAYPGHYIQFLNAKQFPTKTRKLLYAASNGEGWAHYAEQMMIEEGFGADDPRLHLAQLHEALLRDARYIVGIKLHTQGWTVNQGAQFFEERAFQEPANAYEEARRGAYNPTYLYYTLGKLQIYKLRDDYRKARGAEYSLEKFHDEFVRQGSIPIRVIRKILLPGDNGDTL
jgi:uncharacterized protein (DUF885 family)